MPNLTYKNSVELNGQIILVHYFPNHLVLPIKKDKKFF